MRITAHFYTTDEADAAAAALRGSGIDGIFDITVRSGVISADSSGGYPANVNYSGSDMSAAYPVSVMNAGDGTVFGDRGADVDVICRPSESRRVSGILINRGGHRLRGR